MISFSVCARRCAISCLSAANRLVNCSCSVFFMRSTKKQNALFIASSLVAPRLCSLLIAFSSASLPFGVWMCASIFSCA